MKITRASVEEFVKSKGLEPVQIDGIPEGFSYKEPSITIGGVHHEGRYTAFIPMMEWPNQIYGTSIEELLIKYKKDGNKRN